MTKTDLQKFLGQAEMTVAEWKQYDLNKDNEIQKREFVAVIDGDEVAKQRIRNEATTTTKTITSTKSTTETTPPPPPPPTTKSSTTKETTSEEGFIYDRNRDILSSGSPQGWGIS